jgi:hypothetical protein
MVWRNGKHSIVLMRRHGATVVGTGLRELVFRAIYSCDNARYLSEAKRLGNFSPLTPGEIEMAQAIYQLPSAQSRAWEYWAMRLAKRGGMPSRAANIAKKEAAAKPAKKTIKKATKKPLKSKGGKRG